MKPPSRSIDSTWHPYSRVISKSRLGSDPSTPRDSQGDRSVLLKIFDRDHTYQWVGRCHAAEELIPGCDDHRNLWEQTRGDTFEQIVDPASVTLPNLSAWNASSWMAALDHRVPTGIPWSPPGDSE